MPSEGVPKCQRCRRDHKKCSPENRPWPGPKCDRCESYGYECSENMMARRSSQKGDFPHSMRGFVQELSQAKCFDYHQNVSRTLAIRPPPTPILDPIQQTVPNQSPWTGLFEYLRDIDWSTLGCFTSGPGSDPFPAFFTSAICPVPEISNTPLGRRQMYLEAFYRSQRLMQHSSATMPAAPSLEASINILVVQLQRQYPHLTTAFTFEELAKTCGSYVQYGSYWSLFRNCLQTDEVLLIDPYYSFDTTDPLTTFEGAERVWLCQELGLRQFCQKLSGVSQMISDLARTEFNSEERAFLAAKIPDRLEEVLGPRSTLSLGTIPSYPTSPTSFFPTFPLESSPVDTLDGELYSPCDSIVTEESDSSWGRRAYQPVLDNACFAGQVWSN